MLLGAPAVARRPWRLSGLTGNRTAIRGAVKCASAYVQEAQVGGGRGGLSGTCCRCSAPGAHHWTYALHSLALQANYHLYIHAIWCPLLQAPASAGLPQAHVTVGPPPAAAPKKQRAAPKLPSRPRKAPSQPQQQHQQPEHRTQQQRQQLVEAELTSAMPAQPSAAEAAPAGRLQTASAGPTGTPHTALQPQPPVELVSVNITSEAVLASDKRADAAAARRARAAARKAEQEAARLAAERDAELQHIRIEQLREKVVVLQQQLRLLPAQMSTMAQASLRAAAWLLGCRATSWFAAWAIVLCAADRASRLRATAASCCTAEHCHRSAAPLHPCSTLQVANDMRAQLAEQEAAAEALLAEKEAAEEVAEQLWIQLQAVQEQAVEALQRLEDADAHKARLQQVGGCAVGRVGQWDPRVGWGLQTG